MKRLKYVKHHLPAANRLDRVPGLVLHGSAEQERQLPDVQEGVLVSRAHLHAVQFHHAPGEQKSFEQDKKKKKRENEHNTP